MIFPKNNDITDEELDILSANISAECRKRNNIKIKQAKETIYTKIDEIKAICEEYDFEPFVIKADEDIFFEWDGVRIE